MVDVPSGYKQTKVGVVPKDWDVVRLGDKFHFIKTYSNSRSHLSDSGDMEYMHYGDIHTKYKFHIDFTKVSLPKISKDNIKGSVEYIKNGDLIIADASEDYADIGKSVEVVNLGNRKVVSGLHTFLLRDKNDNFSHGYKGLLLYNKNVSKELKKIATGISVLGISKTNLAKLLIPIPPLKEQQKIAQVLTTWDDAISKQEKLIKAKERLKKGLMQKLLSGDVRFAGLDEEWEEVRLGDVATFSKGKGISKNDISDTGIECIRYGELFTVYNEVIENVVSKTMSDTKMVYSEKNDTLMPTSDVTPTGLATASALSQSDIILGGDILIIRSTKIINTFLSYYIRSHKNDIMKLVSGVTVYHVYAADMKTLKIKLPSKQEQQKITQVLTHTDKEIVLLKKELEILKEQKKGLMQRLLTGIVRVKV